MDDDTSPSSHVRHNLEGLGAVYPPAYLLSFVKDDPAELLHGADDMSLYFRSRMPGVLGFSLRGEEFGEEDTGAMITEIARYKAVRDSLLDASLLALTPQSGSPAGDGWDAVEVLSVSSDYAVVYAFATAAAPHRTTIRLQGLDPEARYVVSRNSGKVVGDATGADLMADGISVAVRPATAATMLIVTKQPPQAPVVR
jgi:hypothetical protein